MRHIKLAYNLILYGHLTMEYSSALDANIRSLLQAVQQLLHFLPNHQTFSVDASDELLRYTIAAQKSCAVFSNLLVFLPQSSKIHNFSSN